ncbi:MAG: MMPL family transporter [Solirubrobacteraceae bacterium]|nr:MMPL family transporter [Solirubrobacteraceae bacterium]
MSSTRRTSTPQRPRGIAARAGRWSAHHKKTAVFGWLAFVIVAFVVGGMVGTKKLDDADTGAGESGRAEKALDKAFPKETASESILVQAPDGSLSARDPDVRAAVSSIMETVENQPGVSEVTSPYEQKGSISADGKSLLIDYEIADTEAKPAVDEIDAINAQVAKAAKEYPTLRVEPFGDATAEKQIEGRFEDDFQRAETLSLPITLIILVFAFGALVAAGLPLLLALTAVFASLGLVALPSQLLPVDDAISSVILLIGMAVGVDYSLFYLRREREERAKGRTTEEAIDIAAATSGKAILVSGLTVIIAMSGMFLTGDKTFMSFGVGTIIVVAAAMIGSITVVPAMLAMLGPKVDKGRIPFLGRRSAGDSKVWGAILTPVLKFPLVAALLSVALLGAMALPALGMKTADSGIDTLPRDLPVMQTYDHIQAAFPGQPIPAIVAVEADDVGAPKVVAAIDRMVDEAQATGLFGQSVSVETSDSGRVASVSIAMKGNGSDEKSVDGLTALRDDIIPATLGAAGVEASVTGYTAESEDWSAQMRGAAPLVFGFVLTLAFLLLLVTFRSVVIPLTGIAMNLLSVAAAYGALVWVFQKGNLEGLLAFDAPGAVTSWLPIFLFVILFGLSMDYHVFILSRIKELRDGGMATDESISRGIRSTAGVVTSAAVVMVAVFAIFGSLSMIEMKQMGVGLAVAIALDATIVRGVLLPSVMKMLGEANWYLPKWLEWLPNLDHGTPVVMDPEPELVREPAPELAEPARA